MIIVSIMLKMFTLSSFPTEILENILYYNDLEDISTLLRVGSKLLSYKLNICNVNLISNNYQPKLVFALNRLSNVKNISLLKQREISDLTIRHLPRTLT